MSATDIANEALSLLGDQTISDISTDTITEATLANLKFAPTRKDLLRQHPWNFAIKRAELAADATDPVFGYEKAYTLPADCLRVLKVADCKNWKVEASRIVCNLTSPIYIVYVADITDDTKWDPAFHVLFVYKLAAELAFALTSDKAQADKWMQAFLIQREIATGVDGTEDIADEWFGVNCDQIDARERLDIGE